MTYKVLELAKPHSLRFMGYARREWNLRETLNQEVKSVSDLCSCSEIARKDHEEKIRPKKAPGEYIFRKQEKKSRQEGTRKGIGRELWSQIRVYIRRATFYVPVTSQRKVPHALDEGQFQSHILPQHQQNTKRKS